MPDNSTYADALAVVDRLGAADVLPPSVLRHLKSGAANDVPETPGSDHPAYAAVDSGSNQWLYNVLVGTNAIALQAAATEAPAPWVHCRGGCKTARWRGASCRDVDVGRNAGLTAISD